MVHHEKAQQGNHQEKTCVSIKQVTDDDTIIATATPNGRGGVAVIRASGPLVPSIVEKLLKKKLQPRFATLTPFYDHHDTVVDEGIALFFPKPHSFTGEDVLELHSHGGHILPDLLMEIMLHCGARVAKPGEFTERAFLNDKMDLTQAEAIADLIDASSKEAAICATRSLRGEFSKTIQTLMDDMVLLRTYIEAAIDFSEEEIDFLTQQALLNRYQELGKKIESIMSLAKQGQRLKDGLKIVITGEPNVGKSSLMNALSQKDIAIVTNIPGTTRDVLQADLLLDGVPIQLIDTAGVRDSQDLIEQEGIKRAKQELLTADLIIQMQDVSISHNLQPLTGYAQPIIYVMNKQDLVEGEALRIKKEAHPCLYVSLKNNTGLELLKAEIKKVAGIRPPSEGLFLARRRHLDALRRAREALNQGSQDIMRHPELIAENLKIAHQCLSEITGTFTSEDLLGSIFSSFCIGK